MKHTVTAIVLIAAASDFSNRQDIITLETTKLWHSKSDYGPVSTCDAAALSSVQSYMFGVCIEITQDPTADDGPQLKSYKESYVDELKYAQNFYASQNCSGQAGHSINVSYTRCTVDDSPDNNQDIDSYITTASESAAVMKRYNLMMYQTRAACLNQTATSLIMVSASDSMGDLSCIPSDDHTTSFAFHSCLDANITLFTYTTPNCTGSATTKEYASCDANPMSGGSPFFTRYLCYPAPSVSPVPTVSATQRPTEVLRPVLVVFKVVQEVSSVLLQDYKDKEVENQKVFISTVLTVTKVDQSRTSVTFTDVSTKAPVKRLMSSTLVFSYDMKTSTDTISQAQVWYDTTVANLKSSIGINGTFSTTLRNSSSMAFKTAVADQVPIVSTMVVTISSTNHEDKKLSTGELVGIIIGSIAGVGLCIAGYFWYSRYAHIFTTTLHSLFICIDLTCLVWLYVTIVNPYLSLSLSLGQNLIKIRRQMLKSVDQAA